MSKFKVSDRTVTMTRTLPITNVPTYNANKLYDTKIDTTLYDVPTNSVLYYDGSQWTHQNINTIPNISLYGSFISMTTQYPDNLNPQTTPVTITYSERVAGTINTQGGTYPSGNIVIPIAGTYRILFSVQCYVNNNSHWLEIFPVVNNTPIPKSNTRINLTKQIENCLTVEYFLELGINDVLKFNMIGETSNDPRIIAIPRNPPSIPDIPSIIVNINRI